MRFKVPLIPVTGCHYIAKNFIEEQGLGMIYHDISNIDYSKLMDTNFYQQCQEHIVNYRKSHQHYKNILHKFVLG